MSTTNKLLVGVVIVAAAYTGSAWYMGKKAETEIYRQVAELNATIATHHAVNLDDDSVQIKVVNYQRGWFSSGINYELVVENEGEQYQLLFEDQLRHGPLPFQALVKGHFAPILAYSELKLLPSQNVQPWFDATQAETPITAHSFIDFDGSTASQIDIAAVNYKDAEGNQLLSTAAQANIHYQRAKDQIKVDANFPNLAITDGEDQTNLQFNGTHFKGELTGLNQGQQSNGELKIEQLNINLAQSMQIKVDNLVATSSYELNNQLLDSALYYKLDKVRVDDHDLGKLELDLIAKRLDYQALTLLTQSDQEVDELTEVELQPLLQTFFSHQPELHIKTLNWINEAGKSEITADVQMATTAADDYLQNEMDLAHFFHRLDVDVNLSRPMILALFPSDSFMTQLVDMLFSRFAEQGKEAGLLSYDGKEAKLKLQYDAKNNQLILNGQPAHADELLQAWLLLQMSGQGVL